MKRTADLFVPNSCTDLCGDFYSLSEEVLNNTHKLSNKEILDNSMMNYTIGYSDGKFKGIIIMGLIALGISATASIAQVVYIIKKNKNLRNNSK